MLFQFNFGELDTLGKVPQICLDETFIINASSFIVNCDLFLDRERNAVAFTDGVVCLSAMGTWVGPVTSKKVGYNLKVIN